MDSSQNEGESVEKRLRKELRSKDEEILNLRKEVQDLKAARKQLEEENKLLQTKVDSLLLGTAAANESAAAAAAGEKGGGGCDDMVAECKEAAFRVAKEQFLAGMAYEPSSGLYYDYKTGYYYDNDRGLFYDGSAGVYYSYNYETQSYQVHSTVVTAPTTDDSTTKTKKKRKKRKRQLSAAYSDVTEELAAQEASSRLLVLEEQQQCCVSAPASPIRLETVVSEEEEGEIGSSSSFEEEEESSDGEDAASLDGGPPPCIRMMVVTPTTEQRLQKADDESTHQSTGGSGEKVGSLFIVTCKGGTIGREGSEHQVLLAGEVGCSKHHASITFDEKKRKYYIEDLSSRNGTFVNGARIESGGEGRIEIGHGTRVQVGNTCLSCHVHPGRETCLDCEPGNVQQASESVNKTWSSAKRDKERKKELQRLKNKFGVAGDSSTHVSKGFHDRSADRRRQAGSDNPYEKTSAASTHTAIESGNKGFKMLAKMGWSQGQGLGSEGKGRAEPIPMTANVERAGLGTSGAVADPTLAVQQSHASKKRDKDKAEILLKTQQRYKAIE